MNQPRHHTSEHADAASSDPAYSTEAAGQHGEHDTPPRFRIDAKAVRRAEGMVRALTDGDTDRLTDLLLAAAENINATLMALTRLAQTGVKDAAHQRGESEELILRAMAALVLQYAHGSEESTDG